MKKSLLGGLFFLSLLLLMGACTQGLNEPAPVGGDRTAPGRAEGTPLADLPTREELLRSSKFLEFKDFKTFTAAVVQATQTEPAKQFAAEAAQGFVSLKRLLEREIDNFAASEAPKFANLTAEQLKTAEARIQTELQAYHGFITFSAQNAFELAVSPSAYGHLLNRDGVVKIGPDLYQFTNDRMKVIRGGDESRIPELFGTTTSDPAKGIEVSDIRVGSGPEKSARHTVATIHLPKSQWGQPYQTKNHQIAWGFEKTFLALKQNGWASEPVSSSLVATGCGGASVKWPGAQRSVVSCWSNPEGPPSRDKRRFWAKSAGVAFIGMLCSHFKELNFIKKMSIFVDN